MMGLVSLFTDFSSEMMNPLLQSHQGLCPCDRQRLIRSRPSISGKPEIDDKAVVEFFARQGQRRLCILGGVDLIARFAQAAMQKLSNCLVIFNYQ